MGIHVWPHVIQIQVHTEEALSIDGLVFFWGISIDASWPPSSVTILHCMLCSLTIQLSDVKGQKKVLSNVLQSLLSFSNIADLYF